MTKCPRCGAAMHARIQVYCYRDTIGDNHYMTAPFLMCGACSAFLVSPSTPQLAQTFHVQAFKQGIQPTSFQVTLN